MRSRPKHPIYPEGGMAPPLPSIRMAEKKTDKPAPAKRTESTPGPASARGEIDAFLAKAKALGPRADGRRGRLAFALDATMSRQPAWDLACKLQAEMFEEAGAIVDEVEIPGSIHAVLAARLDALPPAEKRTAQDAAVVGRIFWDALIAHLSRQGIEACTYASGAPEFDAGWSRGEDIFVAEVKSLTGAREDQQIRLGVGQILDYAQQLRNACPSTVIHPVLVLEKRPSAARWTALAEGVGLRLTWAPDFTGI